MRKAVLLIALGLWTIVALAAGKFTPLNVKTGYWESTINMNSSGSMGMTPDMQARLAQMSPQQRAMIEGYMKGMNMVMAVPKTLTSKGCWTEKDLNNDPLFEDKCTWTDLTSTGTELDGKGMCRMGNDKEATANVTTHISVVDPEHVRGTVRLILNTGGHAMTVDYKAAAKYLSPVCGKNESHMVMQTKP